MEIKLEELSSVKGTSGNFEERSNKRNNKKKQFQQKLDEVKICNSAVKGEKLFLNYIF